MIGEAGGHYRNIVVFLFVLPATTTSHKNPITKTPTHKNAKPFLKTTRTEEIKPFLKTTRTEEIIHTQPLHTIAILVYIKYI